MTSFRSSLPRSQRIFFWTLGSLAFFLATLLWIPQGSVFLEQAASSLGWKRMAHRLLLRTATTHPTPKALQRLAQSAIAESDLHHANWALDQWAQLFPTSFRKAKKEIAVSYIDMGKIALRHQDWKSARSFYKKALHLGASPEILTTLANATKAKALQALKKSEFPTFLKLAQLAHEFGVDDKDPYRKTARQAFYTLLHQKKLKKARDLLDLMSWLEEDPETVKSLSWELGFALGKKGAESQQTDLRYRGWELMLRASPPTFFKPPLFSPSFLPTSDQPPDFILQDDAVLFQPEEPVVALKALNPRHIVLITKEKIWELNQVAGKAKLLFTHWHDFLFAQKKLYLLLPTLSPKGIGRTPAEVFSLLSYSLDDGSTQEIGESRGRILYLCGLNKLCTISPTSVEVFSLKKKQSLARRGGTVYFLKDATLFLHYGEKKSWIAVQGKKKNHPLPGKIRCSLYSNRSLFCQTPQRASFLFSKHGETKISGQGEVSFARHFREGVRCCVTRHQPISFLQILREETFRLPSPPGFTQASSTTSISPSGLAVVRSLSLQFTQNPLTLSTLWLLQGKRSYAHLPSFYPILYPTFLPKEKQLYFILRRGSGDALIASSVNENHPYSEMPQESPSSPIAPLYDFLADLFPKKGEEPLPLYLKAVKSLYGREERS